MAVLTIAPHGAECVFSTCGHAPATQTYHHEFVVGPPKHLCEEHAATIKRVFKL